MFFPLLHSLLAVLGVAHRFHPISCSLVTVTRRLRRSTTTILCTQRPFAVNKNHVFVQCAHAYTIYMGHIHPHVYVNVDEKFAEHNAPHLTIDCHCHTIAIPFSGSWRCCCCHRLLLFVDEYFFFSRSAFAPEFGFISRDSLSALSHSLSISLSLSALPLSIVVLLYP